jgi:hypothetical protein
MFELYGKEVVALALGLGGCASACRQPCFFTPLDEAANGDQTVARGSPAALLEEVEI